MFTSEIKNRLEELKHLMLLNSPEQSIRNLATEIINSLRHGIAPNKGILNFSVGREEILDVFKRDMQNVRHGKSKFRLLNGNYGSGKTHVLYLFREIAYKAKFASSFVTLMPRECPMSDLGTVYNHIVRGIRTDNCRDRPALELILQKWLERILALGSDNPRDVLEKLGRLNSNFQNVITTYVESTTKNSWETRDLAVRWMQGEIKNARDLKTIHANCYACDTTALEMLQNLVLMLEIIGFYGITIFLDEGESIPCISRQSQILNAYENFRKLINCSNSTKNLYFIYSTTPAFFSGFEKDNPLKINVDDILYLHPLPRKALEQLAIRIRDLHLQAYKWSNIERLFAETLLRYVQMFTESFKDARLSIPNYHSNKASVVCATTT